MTTNKRVVERVPLRLGQSLFPRCWSFVVGGVEGSVPNGVKRILHNDDDDNDDECEERDVTNGS